MALLRRTTRLVVKTYLFLERDLPTSAKLAQPHYSEAEIDGIEYKTVRAVNKAEALNKMGIHKNHNAYAEFGTSEQDYLILSKSHVILHEIDGDCDLESVREVFEDFAIKIGKNIDVSYYRGIGDSNPQKSDNTLYIKIGYALDHDEYPTILQAFGYLLSDAQEPFLKAEGFKPDKEIFDHYGQLIGCVKDSTLFIFFNAPGDYYSEDAEELLKEILEAYEIECLLTEKEAKGLRVEKAALAIKRANDAYIALCIGSRDARLTEIRVAKDKKRRKIAELKKEIVTLVREMADDDEQIATIEKNKLVTPEFYLTAVNALRTHPLVKSFFVKDNSLLVYTHTITSVDGDVIGSFLISIEDDSAEVILKKMETGKEFNEVCWGEVAEGAIAHNLGERQFTVVINLVIKFIKENEAHVQG